MKPYPNPIYLSATWKGDDRALTVQMANSDRKPGCDRSARSPEQPDRGSSQVKRAPGWSELIQCCVDRSGLVVGSAL